MAAAVIGGILGGALGIYQTMEQAKASKQQAHLAQQQLDMQKKTYEDQSQALNAANQKEVDADKLLTDNTIGSSPTTLTGSLGSAPNKNQLQKNNVLGA